MDFFVTYHAADQRWAEGIGRRLEEAGYSVELQSWDYWARSSFVLEMFAVSAIAESTIALLSPDFLADNLARPEWVAAYAQDPTGAEGILIPVRVRDCDVATPLPDTPFLDLAGLEDAAAVQVLLSGIREIRERKG